MEVMNTKPGFFLVSYDFPPIGGGGVQRNVKFLKYLDRLGWDTHVLTVKERDFYVFDHTLLDEIPNATIHKSASLDPVSLSYSIKKALLRFKKKKTTDGDSHQPARVNESAWYVNVYRFIRDWFLLPDGFGLWIPLAFRQGKKILREVKPQILYATFPHPTNALLTYRLHKSSGIPFVIDFRDGWIDDPYVDFPSAFHRWYHRRCERMVLKSAGAVVVYGDPLKISLQERYPFLSQRIHVITNGFDPEDFDNLEPVIPSKGKKRLVYSGAVYVDRRETFQTFIKALAELTADEKELLEVYFIGDQLKWAVDMVNEFKLDDVIKFSGYLSHKAALNYLSGADAALMFLKAGDVVALTGKIFEYLGLRLPVIACVEPHGACAKLLSSIQHDQGVCPPDDKEKILGVIRSFLNDELQKLSLTGMQVFSRKYHASQLNEILKTV
jgi:glycosyltransferase involved in cell wall biosynthesis